MTPLEAMKADAKAAQKRIDAQARIVTDADAARMEEIRAIPRHAVRDIAEVVAERTGVEVDEIFGRERARHIDEARRLVMFMAHASGVSLSAIGRAFGRNHKTVLSAIETEKRHRMQRKPTPSMDPSTFMGRLSGSSRVQDD